jgi:hypothetical protein
MHATLLVGAKNDIVARNSTCFQLPPLEELSISTLIAISPKYSQVLRQYRPVTTYPVQESLLPPQCPQMKLQSVLQISSPLKDVLLSTNIGALLISARLFPFRLESLYLAHVIKWRRT